MLCCLNVTFNLKSLKPSKGFWYLYPLLDCRFGGDKFSFSRMSWIKTNFLWMMFRCGWATKPGQECVLTVRLSHDGFNTILFQVNDIIIYSNINFTILFKLLVVGVCKVGDITPCQIQIQIGAPVSDKSIH